ncbi:MAG: hypothetical protein JSS66_08220 [Armatimonadetes bacterium]|nr:hypothetical protein [Armatimonadota bacterium]
MTRKPLFAFVVAASLALPALAGTLESGLAKGDNVVPFHPEHISGPLAGTDKCFPCTFGKRPAVQAWINGDDKENVIAIAKDLQANMDAHKDKEFKALIVVVTPDPKGAKAKVLDMVKESGAKDIGVALVTPSHEAIKLYKINLGKDVKNTVFLYKDWVIAQKFVNLKMDDKSCKEFCGAIDSLVQ